MPRQACLTSARFAFICDILSPTGAPVPTTDGSAGHWEWQQNDESGAIEQVWVDDATTVDVQEATIQRDVPLFAEGIYDGGIRVAGTTERFKDIYENVDFVQAVFGSGTHITKRDRVTNIRNKTTGEVIWKEEEMSGWPATTFNVQGVTPVLFMGKVVEKAVLLERAEVQ